MASHHERDIVVIIVAIGIVVVVIQFSSLFTHLHWLQILWQRRVMSVVTSHFNTNFRNITDALCQSEEFVRLEIDRSRLVSHKVT